MKRVDKLSDSSVYADMAEISMIANTAVKAAREENARLGLPEPFYKNGKVYYSMPDGTIQEELPDIYKKTSE